MKTQTWLKRLAGLGVLAIAVSAAQYLPVEAWMQSLEGFRDTRPLLAVVSYLALSMFLIVLLLPGWLVMMSAGYLFGPLVGWFLAMTAITSGATAAFLAGRTVTRDWVREKLQSRPDLLALDRALENKSFLIVMLTRLALVLPFNVLNYLFGATRVDVKTYSAATMLGMVPAVSLYVYIGTLADDVGQILSGDARPDAGTWWVAAIAVVAIIAVVIVIQRTAARVLAAEVEGEND